MLRLAAVAGEVSGDQLGGAVLGELNRCLDRPDLVGIGGACMAGAGLTSLFDMQRLSVMGLVQPLLRLPELLRMRRQLLGYLRAAPPQLFLGIDAPEFNLGLARRLRGDGVATAQLVSPSVWAWRPGRVARIREAVDLMLTLFPFETEVYEQAGVPVRCVGHPLADDYPLVPVTAEQARARLQLDGGEPVLALLPGSRLSEVRQLGPLFLAVARQLRSRHRGLRCLLPAAGPEIHRYLANLLDNEPALPVRLLSGQARHALAAADAVLVTAGTATLEALLARRPMVIAWRGDAVSYQLLSRLLRTRWIGLPNLLARRALVPEFIQHEADVATLCAALEQQLAVGQSGLPPDYERIHRDLARGAAVGAADALAGLLRERGVAVDG